MRQLLLIIFICAVKFTTAQTADDYYNEAQTSIYNEDYKTALEKIEIAIKLDSSNVDFYDLKAHSLFELQEYQLSYDTYNQAISIFPDKSFLYSNRGNLLLGFQESDLAILDFTAAMELADNDSTKHYSIVNRAAAKLLKRDFDGAYQDLLIAYAFDSTSIATLTNLGAVSDEIGKGDETLKYLLKAIEIDPSYYPAYGNIGFKYQELGQHAKAIEYYNKVLELQPEEPLGYSNRSFNKLKLGDLKGAMTDIQKSIKLYPANPYAYRIRALIWIEDKNIERACADLQTALDKGFTVTYGEEVIELQKKHCKK